MPKKKKEATDEVMPIASRDWKKRVLIFIPTMGTVRMEWVIARYGQIIPPNWSYVDYVQYMQGFGPMGYQLADAQNLMAKVVVEQDYEWILYIEDDNIIPPDFLMKMNAYMNEGKYPVVSGLYFTRSTPSEPMVYRGRGNSYYGDWKIGDKVMCDGVPFGARLEHSGMIKEAWKNSPEYKVGETKTRKVFDTPAKQWYDPEKGGIGHTGGTTDLEWCTRMMDEKLLEKAGFPEFQKMENPYLVDTSIFVKHQDRTTGQVYPEPQDLRPFVPDEMTDEIKQMPQLLLQWQPFPEGRGKKEDE